MAHYLKEGVLLNVNRTPSFLYPRKGHFLLYETGGAKGNLLIVKIEKSKVSKIEV